MIQQMTIEGSGQCINNIECEAACPRRYPPTGLARLVKVVVTSQEPLAIKKII